jgi:PAS domain S-box-containing protein
VTSPRLGEAAPDGVAQTGANRSEGGFLIPGTSGRISVVGPPPPRAAPSGWAGLFWEAFKRSRNAMTLLDDDRRHVEVNGAYLQLLGYPRERLLQMPIYDVVADGPILSLREWRKVLQSSQFTGVADVIRDDGARLTVDFAGHPEVVTGRRFVLLVATGVGRRRRRAGHEVAKEKSTAALSARELDVVELIALGLSGSEIAHELQLAHNTVRTHARNAMRKAGARSRAQLVAMALGDGMVPRPSG